MRSDVVVPEPEFGERQVQRFEIRDGPTVELLLGRIRAS